MAPGLTVAGEGIPLGDAVARILGYCLDPEPVRWFRPLAGVEIEPAEAPSRGAHAYRTYDCVPAFEGTSVEFIDIVVADGLNAMMRAKDIACILTVSKQLGGLIEDLDTLGLDFWQFSASELCTRPRAKSERAWPLWAAWTLLMGVEGVDVARCHKILHHKRPRVFPLIDSRTLPFLTGGPYAWASIHDDLTRDGAGTEWAELETIVNQRLRKEGCKDLFRLRMHDILLWLRATGR